MSSEIARQPPPGTTESSSRLDSQQPLELPRRRLDVAGRHVLAAEDPLAWRRRCRRCPTWNSIAVEERRPEVADVGVLRVALEVELAPGLEARDVALRVALDLVGAGVDRVLLAVASTAPSRSKRRANSFGTGTEIGIASAPASAAPVPFVSLNTIVWSSGVWMPLTGR